MPGGMPNRAATKPIAKKATPRQRSATHESLKPVGLPGQNRAYVRPSDVSAVQILHSADGTVASGVMVHTNSGFAVHVLPDPNETLHELHRGIIAALGW